MYSTVVPLPKTTIVCFEPSSVHISLPAFSHGVFHYSVDFVEVLGTGFVFVFVPSFLKILEKWVLHQGGHNFIFSFCNIFVWRTLGFPLFFSFFFPSIVHGDLIVRNLESKISLLVRGFGGYDGGYVSQFRVVRFDFAHAERQKVDTTNKCLPLVV